jgi:hypothetical protein
MYLPTHNGMENIKNKKKNKKIGDRFYVIIQMEIYTSTGDRSQSLF